MGWLVVMRFTVHARRVLLAVQAAARLPACGGAATGRACVFRMKLNVLE